MTSLDTEGYVYARHYVWIPEIPSGFSNKEFIDALQAAVNAMESDVTLTDEDGDTIAPSITVRDVRMKEARGLYLDDYGNLRPVHGEYDYPQALRDLTESAWRTACGI